MRSKMKPMSDRVERLRDCSLWEVGEEEEKNGLRWPALAREQPGDKKLRMNPAADLNSDLRLKLVPADRFCRSWRLYLTVLCWECHWTCEIQKLGNTKRRGHPAYLSAVSRIISNNRKSRKKDIKDRVPIIMRTIHIRIWKGRVLGPKEAQRKYDRAKVGFHFATDFCVIPLENR